MLIVAFMFLSKPKCCFDRYVTQCTLQMFADMKCDDLDVFIMACQDGEKPEFTAKSKIPKKGTLRVALVGERNKILIAFDCRQIKKSFGGLPQDTEIDNDENRSITDQLGVFAVSLGERGGDIVLPSQLLSDDRWVRFVLLLLDLENLNVSMTISEQQKINADHLVKILRNHFQQHLIHHIRDKCKRTHWSMHFAYSNLAVSAACMVLSNHTVEELCCLQDSDSLLSPTPYNFYQCAQFPNHEGAYLYYDGNKGCFVRSGKVTRRGFTVGGKEHLDESKKVKHSTHFYDLYPSSTCHPRAHKRVTKGTFQALQQVIGAGWDPISDVAKKLDRCWVDGGLLIVNEKETKQIKSSMGKALTDMQKFHDMCAYQFELGYDLALSPSCNVLESPGFESVLGIYGGR